MTRTRDGRRRKLKEPPQQRPRDEKAVGDHIATSQILPQFLTKLLRLMFSENYPIGWSRHPELEVAAHRFYSKPQPY